MNMTTKGHFGRHRVTPALAALVLALALFVPPVVDASDATKRLDIIVYGASGRVGSRVVDEALRRGHHVTAVSRDPARIGTGHANLEAVEGNLLDPASVTALIAGQDVVVVAVRGSLDDSGEPEQTVHYAAAQVLIEVLRQLGDTAPRLIFVGGAGSLEVEPGVTYWQSLGSFSKAFIPDFVLQEIRGHLLVLDALRAADDLRWTYISPPKTFEPGERTGRYRIGRDTMLTDEHGDSRISMEDYAVALVDEAENGAFIGTRFTVAHDPAKNAASESPAIER